MYNTRARSEGHAGENNSWHNNYWIASSSNNSSLWVMTMILDKPSLYKKCASKRLLITYASGWPLFSQSMTINVYKLTANREVMFCANIRREKIFTVAIFPVQCLSRVCDNTADFTHPLFPFSRIPEFFISYSS